MNPELAMFFLTLKLTKCYMPRALAVKKHVQNKVLVLDGISAGLVGSF